MHQKLLMMTELMEKQARLLEILGRCLCFFTPRIQEKKIKSLQTTSPIATPQRAHLKPAPSPKEAPEGASEHCVETICCRSIR